MTIMQRAAIIAAMTLSLAGLAGAASAETPDRTAIPAPASAVQVINTVAPIAVPAPRAAPALQMVQSLPVSRPAALPAVTEDDGDYDSLAEAVAAQQSAEIDEAQRCLAGAIYFESKGEPLAGQLAVANVIINRSKSGRFPADVCSVVKQRGQFSFVRGGEIPSIDEGRTAWRTALAVAKVAMAAAWESPAPKALFFNTPDRRPGRNLTRIAMIGHHVFYR
ncbi:cell wall hydrolase [Sphingomonas sp. CLY1604]|uniref:cell wall hydrolase n=1 Tax=Sphingomonas sp. CLY1604 TaxID=3457786 RepID=UPI003FD73414